MTIIYMALISYSKKRTIVIVLASSGRYYKCISPISVEIYF